MEIMVGLAIGMLAMVIIIQVISVFEAQRRTTAGTADAQTNGGIALFNIGRELQLAGYPLVPVTASPLECATLSINGAADATVPNRLSPVAIVDDVVGAGVNASPSDTLTLRYGTGGMGGVPTQPLTTYIASAAQGPVSLKSTFGCNEGDMALITSGTSCDLTSVRGPTTDPVGPAPTLTEITLANIPSATTESNLACMGTWTEVTYGVDNGNLVRTVVNNFGAGSTNPVVAGIVNLQVQYGVSATANSNEVTQWVDASGGTWGAPTVANRNRIKSLRIAVVARNAKTEPSVVTSACSSINTPAPTGLCAWEGSALSPAPTIDLSAGDPNWGRYRYRVFETIIPLRNMIWSKDTL
ncbi:MAG: PilW family protein [Burkholderiales bacterium]|nr:PilW family protein [Burkholderiales bacterium]